MKAYKAVASALFGTLIEYYDYALYGFAAPILAQSFFPKSDPTVQLLQAYGIFFAGSCAKPLGSLLFGFIADRLGRSVALKVSILGIAIPTTIIGILPNYNSWGCWATLLLILCRILQGMFVSGESDTARVYVFESLPKQHRCLANSLAYCLCMLGIYAASCSLTSLSAHETFVFQIGNISNWFPFDMINLLNLFDLFNLFNPFDLIDLPNLPAFPLKIQIEHWRIPFLLGGVFGIVLLILRRNIQETQLFMAQIGDKQQNDGRYVDGWTTDDCHVDKWTTRDSHQLSTCQHDSHQLSDRQSSTFIKSVLITMLMTGAAGGQYHFYFVFLPNYLNTIFRDSFVSVSATTSNLSNLSNQNTLLLIFTLCLPLAGFLADKLSSRFNLISLLKITAIMNVILAMINIFSIQQGNLSYAIMILTAIVLSFSQANTFVVILDQFSVRQRCRGASMGHALGSMMFSGSTPFISLWLWNYTQVPCSAFFYFFLLCMMSVVAIQLLENILDHKSATAYILNPAFTK